MPIFNYFVIFCWLIFFVYWLISSIGVKKNLKGQSLWQNIGLRLGIIIILLIFARTTSFGHALQHMYGHYLQYMRTNIAAPNILLSSIGAILSALGIALAILARIHLGKNWGMPMSVKEKPDLVTSGPYKYIRHPIYTGMLTAILGSAFIDGLFWLIPFFIGGVYFLYSMREEEKLLIKQFPNQYPDYKKRTKMLMPFIY